MSEQKYRAFWDEALKEIHDAYTANGQEDEFSLWFNMEYIEDNKNEIIVAVPSEFMWNQMLTRGNVAIVQNKILELTGQQITISDIVKNRTIAAAPVPEVAQPVPNAATAAGRTSGAAGTSSAPGSASAEAARGFADTPERAAATAGAQASSAADADTVPQTAAPAKKHPQLREKYTFDTFVPGENSDFAYKASLAVAKNPGVAYNPILIYGGVGLGKTHLMESIGNYIYSERGDAVKICCISAENFTNEFTSSLANKTIEKFKAKYRKTDVLLLDDIHFLINKTGIQEELFYTFEALHQKKSQMVFTCDRPITELKGIEDRLRTRFSSGMSIDLQPPNYETRRAILEKKLALLDKHISPEVVDYMAKNVQTNVRDLESCLNKMIGYAELINKPLTIEIAQKELRDTFSQPANGSITIEVIQKVVADYYNISLSDLKGKKRSKNVVRPRQIAVYIARNLLDYSFPNLGDEFGGKDHTTMLHSYEKVVEYLKTDSSLENTIQILIREIKDYKK